MSTPQEPPRDNSPAPVPPDPGAWFDDARFGMFVHWDHASQQGLEISWPMVGGVFSLPHCQDVPASRYHASAATFDPVRFDARALARLARASGMRYGVLTARHHSGYSMWPTLQSQFSVASSPGRRDVVREFVEAFRGEGLRVGLYYSLSDWHHPDYPAFTDGMRPYRVGMTPPIPGPEQWARFVEYVKAQLRELLTAYGPIDIVWFDGGWERPAELWHPDELEAQVRSLQPGVLINDRLPTKGDFRTPEQFIPATPPTERWETCLTMNESWGFNPADDDYKSARAIVHALCETTGRGGNLLLNVSPRGDGSLPPMQVDRLEVLARWMARHAEAIHGTRSGLEPWQFYGPSTRRGDRTYLFLLSRPYDAVTVRGVPVRRVERVSVLGTGEALPFRTRTGIIESLLPDPPGEIEISVPQHALDEYATVLAVDVKHP